MNHLRSLFIISSKKAFFILLCLLWGYQCVFRFGTVFLNRFQGIGDIVSIVVLVVLILLSLSYILKWVKVKDVLIGGIVLLVSLLTVLINAEATEAFNELCFPFLTQFFVMYYVGLALYYLVRDDSHYLKYFEYVSIASIIIITLVYRSTSAGFSAEWESIQYIPYWLLPHLLLLLTCLFEKFSLLELIVLIYGFGNLIMFGNRGSTVCFLALLLMMLIIHTWQMKSKKKFIVISLLALLIIIVWFTDLYEMGIMALYQYALSHDMSTRVFQTFLGDYTAGVSFDSGRLDLQKKLVEFLLKNPFGYGLGSDRYFVGQYTHNLFLEIVFELGVIPGSVIIIGIVVCLVNGFKRSVNCYELIRDFFLLLFCIGFIKLFISGSYLSDPYLYMLLGLAVSMNRNKNFNYNTVEDKNE